MSRRLSKPLAATGLFLLVLAVYQANHPRVMGTADCWPNRYTALSLVVHGELDVNEWPVAMTHSGVARRREGRLYSKYPFLTPLLAAPAVWIGLWTGYLETHEDLALLGKLVASILSAASVALLYLAALRLGRPRTAWLASLLYAFGTGTWITSSQDLWSHAATQLFFTAAIALLVPVEAERGAGWMRAFCSGCSLGLAVAARPIAAVAALPLALYGVIRYRRAVPALLAGGLIPLALLAAGNAAVWGHPLRTGYGVEATYFHHPLLRGVYGLLLSWSRGLLVFSPFLALTLVSIWRILRPASWRTRTDAPPALGLQRAALGGVLLHVLVIARWWSWHGAWSVGPRLMSDVLPLLAILMIPALDRLGSPRRYVRWSLWAVLVPSGALALVLHLGAALHFDYGWHAWHMPDVANMEERDPQPLVILRALREKGLSVTPTDDLRPFTRGPLAIVEDYWAGRYERQLPAGGAQLPAGGANQLVEPRRR